MYRGRRSEPQWRLERRPGDSGVARLTTSTAHGTIDGRLQETRGKVFKSTVNVYKKKVYVKSYTNNLMSSGG